MQVGLLHYDLLAYTLGVYEVSSQPSPGLGRSTYFYRKLVRHPA